MSLRHLHAPLVLALLATLAPAQRQDLAQRFDPAQEVGIDQRIGQALPLDLAFRDHTGRELVLGELFGQQPVLLALVYYECPMLCTLVLNGVTSALRTLPLRPGDDFQLVVASIDPADTPGRAAAKRATYLASLDLDEDQPGWTFLVGDAGAIEALAAAVGFRYVYDQRSGEFAHSSGIQVLTPEGVLSRYLYGIEYSARDLRLGLVEASEGRLGTLVDEVLLLCFAYDPATGKYGLLIFGLLRSLGVLLVAALALYITRTLLAERRRARLAAPSDPRAALGPREAH